MRVPLTRELTCPCAGSIGRNATAPREAHPHLRLLRSLPRGRRPATGRADVLSSMSSWAGINGRREVMFPERFHFLKSSMPEHWALLLCHVSFIKTPFNMSRPCVSLPETPGCLSTAVLNLLAL
uniref:Uncharacterized protein n=1 Tax=Myotis myotis TaxID=51298 RepID=A0A7J7Z502_MYOMY|nr:hypothetical protein mMyoMyo1_010395 [Myotis myotis]